MFWAVGIHKQAYLFQVEDVRMGINCFSYNSKKIIPSPLVSVTKNYINAGDDSRLGATYDIQLIGTLVPFMGSPSGNYSDINNAFFTGVGDPPDQVFETNPADFDSLLRKQEAIRHLFSVEGKSLEWEPGTGVAVRSNPRVKSINFTQGLWVNRVDYTIDLQSDFIFINGIGTEDSTLAVSGALKSATEQWTFGEIEGQSGSGFNVTHNVSAQATTIYDTNGSLLEGKEAWEHSRDFVNDRAIGIVDTNIMNKVLGVTTWIGGRYTTTTTVSEKAGTYSIDESWILRPSSSFITENFNVVFDEDIDDPTITYNGTIFGLSNGERAGGQLALTSAKNALPSNAQARTSAIANIGSLISSATIPDFPNTKNIGLNQTDGTLTFSFVWKTGDGALSTKTQEAALTFDANTGIYSLSLVCDITGAGETAADKVTNAKAAIVSDSQARTDALAIMGDQLPSGVTISTTHQTKSTSINNTTGKIRVTWAWTSADDNSVIITVDTSFSGVTIAEIDIPGRTVGPIIQDMGTVTSKVITVSLEGQFDSKPNNATIISQMDAELGIPVGDTHITGDDESFSVTTGRYRRNRVYVVKN